MICKATFIGFFCEHWLFFSLLAIWCLALFIGLNLWYKHGSKNPYADVEKIEIKIITEKENPENADSHKETKLD